MKHWLVLCVASGIRKGVIGSRVGVNTYINVRKPYDLWNEEKHLGDYTLGGVLLKNKPSIQEITPDFPPQTKPGMCTLL